MTQFFTLTVSEAEATQRALDVLGRVDWARRLVAGIGNAGGLSTVNMPLLFEARFALALHDCGVEPIYEHAAGVDNTTVDFHFRDWLVELYSLDESEALKEATWEAGSSFGRVLMSQPTPAGEAERKQLQLEQGLELLDTSAESAAVKKAIRREVMEAAQEERRRREGLFKQSGGAEIVKAIERVVGKVYPEGRPAKFPAPASLYSMLVVDARGVGASGADEHDYRLIAYGADAVAESIDRHMIDGSGRAHPIRGAFHQQNRIKGAQVFRERVHFLGLVTEETYERDELQYSIGFYPNWHLFETEEKARAVLKTFPLFQPGRLRERRPELFVDEITKLAAPEEVEFGIVIDRKIVLCRVHRDTLEDIEKQSFARGSPETIDAFERNKATLRSLAEKKLRRGVLERDGIVFLRPADLASGTRS